LFLNYFLNGLEEQSQRQQRPAFLGKLSSNPYPMQVIELLWVARHLRAQDAVYDGDGPQFREA
jgi:hypothetical protein